MCIEQIPNIYLFELQKELCEAQEIDASEGTTTCILQHWGFIQEKVGWSFPGPYSPNSPIFHVRFLHQQLNGMKTNVQTFRSTLVKTTGQTSLFLWMNLAATELQQSKHMHGHHWIGELKGGIILSEVKSE